MTPADALPVCVAYTGAEADARRARLRSHAHPDGPDHRGGAVRAMVARHAARAEGADARRLWADAAVRRYRWGGGAAALGALDAALCAV
eukprot:scaffold14556_cov119-Isochrysis_galbana.AAC.2